MTTILGDGTVGKALGAALNIEPLGPGEYKVSSDVVIICVPTPSVDGEQDISAVHQAISRIEDTKLIILRSTVLPGTTDELQKDCKFPIMFVPEFGFEASMEADLKEPVYYVMGLSERTISLVPLALSALPSSTQYIQMRTISAEFAKYFTNIWGFSQVILANSLFDWVQALGLDTSIYEEAISGLKMHKNTPKWGWNIKDQGCRGAGGKCLPKDLKAAISQYPHNLWQRFEEINKELGGESK